MRFSEEKVNLWKCVMLFTQRTQSSSDSQKLATYIRDNVQLKETLEKEIEQEEEARQLKEPTSPTAKERLNFANLVRQKTMLSKGPGGGESLKISDLLNSKT